MVDLHSRHPHQKFHSEMGLPAVGAEAKSPQSSGQWKGSSQYPLVSNMEKNMAGESPILRFMEVFIIVKSPINQWSMASSHV